MLNIDISPPREKKLLEIPVIIVSQYSATVVGGPDV